MRHHFDLSEDFFSSFQTLITTLGRGAYNVSSLTSFQFLEHGEHCKIEETRNLAEPLYHGLVEYLQNFLSQETPFLDSALLEYGYKVDEAAYLHF